MIDQGTIDKIMDAADIIDVVSEFVTLKKRGVNYIGLCPFHNEKTPSFTVSPSKGIYKCFGCGKGGNPVNFIMEHEQLSYVEALRFLAKKYHIEIIEKELTEEERQQKNIRESLLVVSSWAQKYFTRTLHEHDEGVAVGLSYLNERGFTEQIIDKFQIGYCLEQRDGFTKEALKNGYKLDYLVQTGLTIQKDTWQADRFSGRVIFPIHSLSGQVIGFGGRTLKTDKKIAKYLNSPESEVYHKSNVLYGLYFGKKAIVQKDKCLLVEGYTDVTSFHQAGIENVVASSGTALTSQQIRLIKRFTSNITVLFDGDAAGLKASIRGIDIILEEGLNVRVVIFPDGEDPDSFAKSKSSSEVIEFLEENEKDFITFKTELLLKEAKDDPAKRADLIKDIVRSISVIPDKPMRAVYVNRCSKLLNADEQMLHYEVNSRLRKRSEGKRTTREIPEEKLDRPKQELQAKNIPYEEEKQLIRILLNYSNEILFPAGEETEKISVVEFIISELINDELKLNHPLFNKIFSEYVSAFSEERELSSKHFINHSDVEISKTSADLIADKNKLSQLWTKFDSRIETEEMMLKKIVPKAINEFKYKYIKSQLKELTLQLNKAQEENNMDKIMELQKQKILLDKVKAQLSSELGERTIL